MTRDILSEDLGGLFMVVAIEGGRENGSSKHYVGKLFTFDENLIVLNPYELFNSSVLTDAIAYAVQMGNTQSGRGESVKIGRRDIQSMESVAEFLDRSRLR